MGPGRFRVRPGEFTREGEGAGRIVGYDNPVKFAVVEPVQLYGKEVYRPEGRRQVEVDLVGEKKGWDLRRIDTETVIADDQVKPIAGDDPFGFPAFTGNSLQQTRKGEC